MGSRRRRDPSSGSVLASALSTRFFIVAAVLVFLLDFAVSGYLAWNATIWRYHKVVWGIHGFDREPQLMPLFFGVRLSLALLFAFMMYLNSRMLREKKRHDTLAPSRSNSLLDVEVDSPSMSINTNARPADEESGELKESAEEVLERSRKNEATLKQQQRRGLIGLTTCFVFFTFSSVTAGIQCAVLESSHLTQGQLGFLVVCYGIIVLASNLEFFFIKSALNTFTSSGGLNYPVLHAHAVTFESGIVGRVCDVCSKRISRECLRCAACDFDCCVECFKSAYRGDAKGDGLLRGDKGTRAEEEISTWKYFARSLKLTRPFMPIVIVAFVCLLLNQAARLFLPNFQGRILDAVVKADHMNFLLNVKWYLALMVSTAVLDGFRQACVQSVSRMLGFEVRKKVFGSLISQDIAFFDGTATGQLTSRLTTDVTAMVNPTSTIINTICANLLLLIGGGFMCFYTSWRLSMVVITSVGPIVYITGLYAAWSRKMNRAIWDCFAEANTVATEVFSNIRIVRAFSTEKVEFGRYEGAINEAKNKGIKDAFASASTSAVTTLLDQGTGILILWYGGNLVMGSVAHANSTLTIGQLITFQLYWNMMNHAYQGLNNVVNSITKAAGAAQRLITIMDMEPDIHPDRGDAPDEPPRGDLELRDVGFHYQMRPDCHVLRGVSVRFPAGKMTAIVGRSGAGKSTIIHLLLRYYDPTSGSIMLDGRDIRDLSVKWIHSHMGLVAQDSPLFARSIADNIRYGNESEDDVHSKKNKKSLWRWLLPCVEKRSDSSPPPKKHKERIKREDGFMLIGSSSNDSLTEHDDQYHQEGDADKQEELIRAARIAHAHDFIETFEDKYQTKVGERGIRLSGGQKQRISIARAVLRKPTILLLDEATSALDAESESVVQRALEEMIKQLQHCSIIVVAHRLSTVMCADQIVVMDKGKVAECGTHSELLDIPDGIYARLVSRQLSARAEGRDEHASNDIDALLEEEGGTEQDHTNSKIKASKRGGRGRGRGGGRGKEKARIRDIQEEED